MPRRLKHVLVLASALVAVVAAGTVRGASAADFEIDDGPCRETPGENLLLRCPTAYVGMEYEVELESEEGSGCTPYEWYEIALGALPAGLSMTRDGVISGTPQGGPGLTRFWVWNHDLTAAQGGPSWCQVEDRSEKEFSIPVDPGLAIVNESVSAGTVGQTYVETLTARQLVTLNPPTGPNVQATWSVESGALPQGTTLSPAGALTGTPTAEGSYQFVVRAQVSGPPARETFTLTVRQPVVVRSPFGPAVRPAAEVRLPFRASATATGGTGTYTWSLSSGELPPGLKLDPASGAVSGRPQAAGKYSFSLTATDGEKRTATAEGALTVAPRLGVATRRLEAAIRAHTYRAKLATRGGVLPTRWKVVSGKLPLGVRLAQRTGVLAGQPRRAGAFRFVVEARDALGAAARRALVLRVHA